MGRSVGKTDRKQTLFHYHSSFPTRKGYGITQFSLVLTAVVAQRSLGDGSWLAQWESQHKILRQHHIIAGERFPRTGQLP